MILPNDLGIIWQVCLFAKISWLTENGFAVRLSRQMLIVQPQFQKSCDLCKRRGVKRI